MPLIPSSLQLLSTDVPGASVDAPAGLASAQAGQVLGKTIEDSSFYILDKLRTAEANDAVFSAKASDSIESEKFSANLLASSPDGYVRDDKGEMVPNSEPVTMGKYQTVTQKYREWANNRYRQTAEDMPNNIAQAAYSKEGGAFFTTEINRMFGQEQSTRFNYSKQQTLVESQKLSDHFVDYPGMYGYMGEMFYSKTDEFAKSIAQKVKVGIYTAAQGMDIGKDEIGKMANSNMGGYIQTIADESRSGKPDAKQTLEANVKAAINVIEGLDEESKARRQAGAPVLSDMLTPHDKEHRINQLLSLVTKHQKEERLGPWETFIKNSADGARVNAGGNGYFETAFNQAIQMGQQFIPTGQQQQSEVFTKAGVILSANAEWEAKQSHFAMLPAAQQAASREQEQRYFSKKIDLLLAKYGTVAPEVKNGILQDVMKTYDQAIVSDQAEYKRDSAAYVIAHQGVTAPGKTGPIQLAEDSLKQNGIASMSPKALSTYLQTVDRLVKSKEPGDPSVWRQASENFSNWYGDQLMNVNVGNPELKANAVYAARKQNPQVFDKFVDQMIKDNAGYSGENKVDYRFQYLKQMPTLPLMTRFFADLQTTQTSIETAFNASFAAGTNTTDYEKFKKTVLAQPEFSKWISGQQQAHEGDPLITKRISALTDFYVRDAARVFQSSGGIKTAEDSALDAYKALIGNSRIVSDSSRGGFFSTAERATIFRVYPQTTPDGMAINQDVMGVFESKIHEVQGQPEFYRSSGKIEPPQDYIERAKRMGLDKQTTYDNFYKTIASTAKWHVDPSSDNGFIVTYRDGFNKQAKTALTKNADGGLVPFVWPFKKWYSGPVPTKINKENVKRQKDNEPIDMGIMNKF